MLDELSTVLKQASFQDAKNTSKDACLLGPPSLEFAPYNKIPTGRARHDGRQGTIDQDQEFIDFLQSLTEPITKPGINDAETNDAKADKVSTTPLVQYIKEKKANKAKEASQAKAAKARESKEAKTSKSESRSTVIIKGKNAPAADKERLAKATQDAVKAVNKSVAAVQGGKQTTSKAEVKQEAKEKGAPAIQPTNPKRERERGNASAAARMLQRDLGLLPKESKAQRAAKAAAASTPTENTSSGKTTSATPKPESGKKDKEKDNPPSTPVTSNPPTGPRASRTPSAASTSTKSAPGPSQRSQKSSQPSAGAKSAFLKHANPSQGITENALQTIFKQFGTITRCEIDKKKGLGYIDFSETEALKKAMQASPVKVGNGQVVVLENKNSQGGGKRGGGQQKEPSNKAAAAASTSATAQTQAGQAPPTPTAVKSPVVKSATPAPATPTTATALTEPSNATTPATTSETPPSASRGSSRRGGRGGRGGGGGGGRGNNGGSGQGSRGRSGGGRGNTRRGGAGGSANTSSNTDGGASATTAAATPAAGGGGGSGETTKD